ncbi:MAG: internal scaffolding protein [Microvirus sp.]|nr:MAG: internal scaffolding protein [Microvirus sp.]
MEFFARNGYNYDVDFASQTTSLLMTEPSLTQQSFKDECDINVIVEQFGITGKLPTAVYMPTFDDFTEVVDFQTALEQIQRAEASFMAMPANVRERFANDSQKFLEFTSDSRNAEEAKALGLFKDAASPSLPIPNIPNPTPITPSNPG